jgi:spermidine synthase
LLAVLAYVLAASTGRVIHEADSPFGGVRVEERRGGVRALYTLEGRTLQSAAVPGRPLDLHVEYTRVAAIGLGLVPEDAHILYVGLGGGAMPMHARHVLPAATIDVVEIDAVIIDAARRYFAFTTGAGMRVHEADGRAFIEQAPPAAWDLIVLDAFSDDEIPRALATQEFLATVRSRLRPGGVVVANLWTSAPLYDAMLATYLAVFADVHVIRVGRRAQNIVIARDADERLSRETLVARARTLAQRTDVGFRLAPLIERGHRLPSAPAAAPLRDR